MKSSSVFSPVSGRELDNHLYSVGFNIDFDKAVEDANIEEALVSASVEAVNKEDNRIGGLLVDWISIHSARINVKRLTDLVFSLVDSKYKLVQVFWCANAQRLLPCDSRFRNLAAIYQGSRVDFADRFRGKNKVRTTDLFIEKRGEDKRFENTCIRLPLNYYPHRPHQIVPAQILSRNHMAFRYRVMMGASFRADVWALLRRDPTLSGYELAKRAHCSKVAATRIRNDYLVVKRDYSTRKAA